MAKSSCRRAAWVPLPAPGGPTRMRLSSDKVETDELAWTSERRRKRDPGIGRRRPYLLEEALVVAHHQLGLELLHRVERDPDHDQDGCPAEEEVGRRLVDE